mmetsp:Transcript_15873/g.24430  ORF Transcript_15873/g.24430 Transcript_15873/m.24430 type:complete len:144 (+) Transcript_15873:574-1005(+)
MTYVGSPYYMSPEQCKAEGYGEKSDIWSLGVIVFELANFTPPFTATNHLALALKIIEGKFERIPMNYSDELMRVIKWMLQVKQEDRPNIEDLLNLPNVSIRLRERALRRKMCSLKQKETQIQAKEKQLHAKTKQLKEREQKVL